MTPFMTFLILSNPASCASTSYSSRQRLFLGFTPKRPFSSQFTKSFDSSRDPSRDTYIIADKFVSDFINHCREESITNSSDLSPHMEQLLSSDEHFCVLKSFLTRTVMSRSWQLATFEHDAMKYLSALWVAILSTDSAMKLPKGRNAPYLYKFIADLSSELQSNGLAVK